MKFSLIGVVIAAVLALAGSAAGEAARGGYLPRPTRPWPIGKK
ncbi:hypothetical protein CpipJ_CPIJ008809 [Culex quinquefasciatus]|uniref:Uncharacterized protein n=1 Tax=Culex quinquefasciatus TaxID=7176 RepID=B0WNU1_CULQU|nr:hypothetical protein CpipJ_CPIJ008809 [Culex quinquefasciatus]|eukprot:XP_001850375.1 hypothetical protein CpipJ_CPIJ008809 [Culex quinquefasciatus]